MKPVTYDFDVITDAPAPKRQLPKQAERAPQADSEAQRRSAAPPEQDVDDQVRAAE